MFRIRSVLPLALLPAAAACATTPIPPAPPHANSPVVPTWNPDAEFRALRPGGE